MIKYLLSLVPEWVAPLICYITLAIFVGAIVYVILSTLINEIRRKTGRRYYR